MTLALLSTTQHRRRHVVKHNLITEVYLMNVMENNYMFRPVLAIIRLSMVVCGTCNCGAPVLLVGVFILGVLALPRAYCLICTVYVAACSIRVHRERPSRIVNITPT